MKQMFIDFIKPLFTLVTLATEFTNLITANSLHFTSNKIIIEVIVN